MSVAVVYARSLVGIKAPLIKVEAHLSNGLPRFSIVGLPETTIKESKDRIRSAMLNAQLPFPNRRITVNLAPADLPKMGSRFDLPIALAILAASGQIPAQHLSDYEFVGELALSGEMRPISGVLPLILALTVDKTGRSLVLPAPNVKELGQVKTVNIYSANTLWEVCQHIKGEATMPAYQYVGASDRSESVSDKHAVCEMGDLSDVLGQSQAKRALAVAAAGRHSLLLSGPPGCGKTLLGRRLISILPPMTELEALEVAAIYALYETTLVPGREQVLQRPYRSPHHTTSPVALVGGGSPPRPGEISLAHHGVLFLDELPEFNRKALEVLREPLEQNKITIARAAHSVDFPAQFQLIAAMNLCPCGYYGEKGAQRCRCSPHQIEQYLRRLSGPLLERIDLHVAVRPLTARALSDIDTPALDSATVRKQVKAAYQYQLGCVGKPYGHLNEKETRIHCKLKAAEKKYLMNVIEKLNLSVRNYHRLLKLAYTVASFRQSHVVEPEDLKEAISYQIGAHYKSH